MIKNLFINTSVICTEDNNLIIVEYNSNKFYIDVIDLAANSELAALNSVNCEKAKAFHAANLKYLQFFADEIYKKSDVVRSMILSKLGLCTNKFAARELVLKDVSISESKKFFNENHLMGYKVGRATGLYKNNNLICALAYKEFNSHIEIERFCTKLNTSCAGGFGKLVSNLKQFNKSIISYCDLRYADGHSYEKVGFNCVGETLGWNWTDGENRFNRLMCRATKDKTEKENAAERGWFKIFDAGQRKFKLV